LPTNRARELFKPPIQKESLLATILKNPGTFGFEKDWCDVTTVWGQRILMTSSGHGKFQVEFYLLFLLK